MAKKKAKYRMRKLRRKIYREAREAEESLRRAKARKDAGIIWPLNFRTGEIDDLQTGETMLVSKTPTTMIMCGRGVPADWLEKEETNDR